MADPTVASQRCHGGEASAAAFAGGGAAQVVAGALFLLDARTICSVGHAAGDGSWCPCSLTFACGCRNPSSHRDNNIGGRSNMLFIQEHPKTIKLVNSTSLGNSPSIAQWPSVYAIHTETSSESTVYLQPRLWRRMVKCLGRGHPFPAWRCWAKRRQAAQKRAEAGLSHGVPLQIIIDLLCGYSAVPNVADL